MSLMHTQGAKARRYLFVTFATTTIAWQPVFAGPQSQSGGSPRAATPRARSCSDCASRDSLEGARERLLETMDSLRWQYEHRRLDAKERAVVAQAMRSTIMALEHSMAETMRAKRVLAAAEGRAAYQAEAPSIAIAVETGYMSQGYIGVTFDGAMSEVSDGEERVVRFYQYPRIALVEPSSPAQRAGALKGDTVLALNGDDLREHAISFTKLLVPDARVTMRVRRDGNQRDLKITVAETPDYFVRRVAHPPMPNIAGRLEAAPTAPNPPSPGAVRVYGRAAPHAPMPASRASSFVYSFNDGVAGAHVETITEGLGKALNVKQGVLILRANPGTPAYRSGLRDGDVVITAAGNEIVRVSDLRRAVATGERSDGVKLVIVRAGKMRNVTLRWQW